MISVFPLHGVGSLSTSTMIHWEGHRFILDCGPGTMTEIWRRKLRLRGLSAILLSHAHLDHLWGLPPLLWFLDQRDWNHELNLIYPPKIESSIKEMLRISGEPEFVKLQPLKPGSQSVNIGRLIIQAFEVNHPDPSCGFTIMEPLKPRLDTKKLKAEGIPQKLWGTLAKNLSIRFKSQIFQFRDYQLPLRHRKLAYTGDTGPSPNLKDAVRDADLVIIDASWLYPQWEPPNEAPHLTLQQAFEICHKANVKRVLLTHLTTRVSQKDYTIAIEKLQQELDSSIPVFLPVEKRIEFD